MNKKKFIAALMVCCTMLSAKATEYTIDQGIIPGGINPNNSAGVAEISNGDTLTITNSTISGNSGNWSGGIYLHDGGSLTITGGTPVQDAIVGATKFENNSNNIGWAGGGAIYSRANSSVNVGDYTSFIQNHSDNIVNGVPGGDSGGAIYVMDSTLTIGNNVTFDGNHAYGELTYVEGYDAPLAYGGYGGAIYAQASSITIGEKLSVKNSSSCYDGGGIKNSGGTLSIAQGAVFDNNKSVQGNGGAVSIQANQYNQINYNTGEVIAEITQDASATINNGTFTNNHAVNGGAVSNIIYNGTDNKTAVTSEVIISAGKFVNNSADQNGGAIYNAAEITLNGAEFSGNKAAQGAALYNEKTANLENVKFYMGSGDAKNDIYNKKDASIIVTGENNLFASDITNNGKFELNGESTITGNLFGNGDFINNGKATLAGNNLAFTGTFENGKDSETTVTGTYLGGDQTFEQGTLNWHTTDSNALGGTLNVTGGILNIGGTEENQTGILTLGAGSAIAGAVQTTLNEGSALNITGADVTLDSATNDVWNGNIAITNGNLTIDGVSNSKNSNNVYGKLLATGGNLTLNNSTVTIDEGSRIADGVKLTTGEDSTTINIIGDVQSDKRGYVYLGEGDSISDATKISLDGGVLDYAMNDETLSAAITAKTGNLNLLSGSYLTFTDGAVAKDVNLNIGDGATLGLKDTVLYLDKNDTWNGAIANTNGTINADNLTKSSNASLLQTEGTLNIYNASNIVLGKESSIGKGGYINITKDNADAGVADGTSGSTLTVIGDIITGGNMKIDEYSKFVVGSGVFNLESLTASASDDLSNIALINTINGETVASTIGDLTINNQANFNIDILARGNHRRSNDQFFVVNNFDDSKGTARIDQWALNGDLYGWDAPIDRHITLDHIFVDKDGNPLEGNIEVTDATTFTPIGWYQLNKNVGAGSMSYTLDMVKYNPQVFRGQVATVAQWMNQLNIDDILFTHSMVLPSFKEADGGKMANRYAAESPLFAPYQYSRKDGGLWYKAYGTFENLQMNNGLSRVGNNAYGVLIGADFGLKELRNGWTFMPTAYIGYNGAHQTFAGMGQYQNGGQAGFLGTWYKDNFILGAMAYGGVYGNSMDVRGFNDETFNYFGGAATKAAYNIRLHRDWVLQPNLFLSYNYFGQQNWHSKFGQMGMMSGDLNGVNIAPGLNLIWEKETFSAYATLQYMYNLNGACGGRAGNVTLPHMEMERGYIQYGLGFTKKLTDRASGYLQAVLRNVGRTGVGFQAGFNIMLGK